MSMVFANPKQMLNIKIWIIYEGYKVLHLQLPHKKIAANENWPKTAMLMSLVDLYFYVYHLPVHGKG